MLEIEGIVEIREQEHGSESQVYVSGINICRQIASMAGIEVSDSTTMLGSENAGRIKITISRVSGDFA